MEKQSFFPHYATGFPSGLVALSIFFSNLYEMKLEVLLFSENLENSRGKLWRNKHT